MGAYKNQYIKNEEFFVIMDGPTVIYINLRY